MSRGYAVAVGWNAYGQLGDGTTKDSLMKTWNPRSGMVTQVSAGGLHSLGVRRP